MEPTKELVYALYSDPLTLGSEKRLVQVLRERGYKTSEQKVRNMLASHQLWQRTRRIKRVFMPIVGRTGQYQLDIMFFPFKTTQTPILTMIHMTTRFAMARVLKSRRMKPNALDIEDIPPIVEAMRSMIEEAKGRNMPIEQIVSDNEFNKKTFRNFLAAHRITMYNPDPRDKATVGMIESFNLVLRRMLNHYIEIHGDTWQPVVPQLLKNYNTRIHSRTKRAPLNVTPRDELRIRGKAVLRSFPAMRLLNSFKEGQTVRYAVRPTPVQEKFYKYGAIFSRDLDNVEKVEGFSVELDGQPGKFRPRNLLKVDALGIDETQDAKPKKPVATRTQRKITANMRMEMRKLETKVSFPTSKRKGDDIYVRIKQVKKTNLKKKPPQMILRHSGLGADMKFLTQFIDGDRIDEPIATFLTNRRPHPLLVQYLTSIGQLDVLDLFNLKKT